MFKTLLSFAHSIVNESTAAVLNNQTHGNHTSPTPISAPESKVNVGALIGLGIAAVIVLNCCVVGLQYCLSKEGGNVVHPENRINAEGGLEMAVAINVWAFPDEVEALGGNADDMDQ